MKLARNDSEPISLRKSGHESVDKAQEKLHLFEAMWFNKTQPNIDENEEEL